MSAQATHDQLRHLCSGVAAIAWPLPRDGLLELAAELGWAVRISISNSVYLDTPLTDSPTPNAVVLIDGDVATQFTIDVSAATPGPSATGALNADYAELLTALIAILGEPTGPTGARSGGTYWELANRGRLWLKPLASTVSIIVLQEAYADTERAEERLGISPDRVPIGNASDDA